ncbi:ABC transporter permease subunit [Catenovulum sediminis]|uniref:ABC transporter permease subunit n=2 Tax=Catenovulum sediminis TaxID=1740262 RepID=A0ABV1RLE5_9ALTE|nr:ABC transporter permease subunit [Catenovulum sediminis]
MVLVALLMIFFYLLYVVKPIFDGVTVEPKLSIVLEDKFQTLALGTDDHVETAYRFTSQPALEYYQLYGPNKTDLIKSYVIRNGKPYSAFAASMPHLKQYAFAYDDNKIVIVKPQFKVGFANNRRQITPKISYPFGQDGIEVSNTRAIEKMAFAVTPEADRAALVYQTKESSAVKFTSLRGELNFMTDETEWYQETIELPIISGKVDDIHVTADLSRALLLQNGELYVFNIRFANKIKLVSKTRVVPHDRKITASSLLAGASSIIIADDSGKICQWFEVNSETGREFTKIRSFQNSNKDIQGIYPEFFRRSFAVTSSTGFIDIYFTTSNASLYEDQILDQKIEKMASSPRADAYLVQTQQGLELFDVENEHPEVTWSALWQETWYEGYSEPDYVWQSTSASDDFEPKFSLVPITFGTIKAAFYAMLFSVPIALAAAIYTAYFMPAKIRTVVKPTVEIMEALPTVILGFLAGLWLAPLIEEHLAAIAILIILLPICIIAFAFMWHNLPKPLLNRLPQGMDSLLLVPVIILVGYSLIELSPWLNDIFFDGDVRLYITDELGISFDQRNSLVVGIAMGFAVIPTIFSIAEDAVFSVPKHLSHGSLALGASQWQTLVRVVLLTASPGIFSAVMMGLGRAVGETMIVLMATGNTPIMDWSVFQGMRTLSANIAVEMPESEVGSTHYRILFLAAFVLFIFTFIFNTIAEFVRQRLRDKYSSL